MSELISKNTNLLKSLVSLIDNTRRRVAIAVNSELTILYWEIGNKIGRDILQHKRADYGKQVIAEISIELTSRYGNSFSKRNLQHFVKFNSVFSDFGIVNTLCTQFSWSHFRSLLSMKSRFRILKIRILDLFRISIFGFRILWFARAKREVLCFPER